MRLYMRIARPIILCMAFALSAFPAYALSLQQARVGGQVGEGNNGYAVALVSTPEVQQLVADVNTRRKQEYQKISQGNGQPVDVVAKLASAQIAQQLEPGSSYQDANGNWKKR